MLSKQSQPSPSPHAARSPLRGQTGHGLGLGDIAGEGVSLRMGSEPCIYKPWSSGRGGLLSTHHTSAWQRGEALPAVPVAEPHVRERSAHGLPPAAAAAAASGRCCHRHDCCYDKAEKAGCSPKAQRYQWACEQNAVRCDNLTDQCEKMVCLCDQEAAKCWGAAPYNPHFILWPDFLCGQTHPTCHFRYGGAE
ncbi:uncharacterized protein LOC141916089 isoform X2 [Strix aluco]|uniref:uncharacterized protein LOC141916089 isoform X2 n=1 Tax=Strix aluco TaxID=111821 RepID=UPI003DA6AB28